MKFKVLGDASANPFFSSSVIINNFNRAAQRVGLYDENGATVVYSTTCDSYGHDADAFICAYEMAFPKPILDNARGRPILGCSYHNMCFAIEGGYPAQLCSYVNLGVNTEMFSPLPRQGNKDVFRFLSFAESNTRCGLEVLVPAFGQEFTGAQDVELYIKDRNATPKFQAWVKEQAEYYNVRIIHDAEHTQDIEQIRQLYTQSDFHVFVNHSSTWALTNLESMAMGVPVIAMQYSGPREYLYDGKNGIAVQFVDEEVTDSKIQTLVDMGMRNHLFPSHCYQNTPKWAQPNELSLMLCLRCAFQNENFRKKLSRNAILTSRYFTWERTAYNLACTLDSLRGQRIDSALSFDRYS